MAPVDTHKSHLPRPWRQHTLRVHIAILFTMLVFLACGIIAWNNYQQGKQTVLSAAADLMERIDNEADEKVKALFAPVETLVTWISIAPLTNLGAGDARIAALPVLTEVLKRQPQLAAVYIGYEDGEFFLVRALRDDALKKQLNAPPLAQFLVQSLQQRGGIMHARFLMLDTDLKVLSDFVPSDYHFDPRARAWYVDAMKSGNVIVTAPYVFFTTRHVGVTVARRAGNGKAVVGADMTLSKISEALQQARPTASSQLAIFATDERRVVAFSDTTRDIAATNGDKFDLRRLGEVAPVLDQIATITGDITKPTRVESGGREWLAKKWRISTGGERSASFLIATPLDELMVEANKAVQRTILLALLVVIVSVPLTWWISHRIAANLRSLTEQAAAMRRFDFKDMPQPRTHISEIFDLGQGMAEMRATIRKFLDITTALAYERNLERLLQRVLKEAHAAAGGDGGVIYLLDDDGQTLKPSAQAWDSSSGSSDAMPGTLSMTDQSNPVASAARHTTAAAIHVLSEQRPAGMDYIDAHFASGPVLLVTVPLLNRGGEVIGMLCVFIDGDVSEPSRERLALTEAFAGAGAAAIDNQRLLLMQKALLESLIGLMAGAIDAKSPYTGGHCQRVPELTKMLTRAACDAKEGPFATFNLDENGWEALHIAGWLHDCGKVTTPEYVVDKATKLETIYDRIHEIRMRFEVLKRDAEIASLKAIAAGDAEVTTRSALQQELSALDAEFAFVASCNLGGEFMVPEKIARLKQIASRTWQRTLDDRLGVSWEEARRMARTPAAPLPATELLLADKPEHVIERSAQDRMPADNPWGFKLREPQHLYNRGEFYNLSIARGTLTAEERYKINDHIAQTIIMLNRLPFPKHLKSVPELAGGHHEKMDGTGYPKCIIGSEMSVPARIMAIADIFEALTAADRPYKKGKKLSEAIKIMASMKQEQHIDPDLFDLFLESGIYRAYAERYLAKEYIDEVDIDAYLTRRSRPNSVDAGEPATPSG